MKLNTGALQRSFLMALGLCVFALGTAQSPSRDGGLPLMERTQSDPVSLPCGGVELLLEDFENNLPSTWTVIDADASTPDTTTGLQPGWNVITDYRDADNSIAASTSYYDTANNSDDWLITPALALGDNPCLSWRAYSQDGSFPEDYEIRVSTTGFATTDFTDLVDSVEAESSTPVTHAIYLPTYANDTVFIAFRQVSFDKFVLALDDILVSNAAANDAGIAIINSGSPQPGDTSRFQLTVGNFGSEPITSFEACWQIDGGAVNCTQIDTVAMVPNSLYSFVHPDSFAFDTLDQFYNFCAWTNIPNGLVDGDASNDTLCTKISIGSPVSVAPERTLDFQVTVFPNPVTHGALNIAFHDLEGRQRLQLDLYDVQGRHLRTAESSVGSGQTLSLDLLGINSGWYFLTVTDAEGGRLVRKIQVD